MQFKLGLIELYHISPGARAEGRISDGQALSPYPNVPGHVDLNDEELAEFKMLAEKIELRANEALRERPSAGDVLLG